VTIEYNAVLIPKNQAADKKTTIDAKMTSETFKPIFRVVNRQGFLYRSTSDAKSPTPIKHPPNSNQQTI
jgi:hypothetical protein